MDVDVEPMAGDPICERRGHRRLSALRRDLGRDVRRHWTDHGVAAHERLSLARKISALLDPSVTCAFVHRVSHWLHGRGWRRAARAAAWLNTLVFKASISPESCLGGGVHIGHPPGIHFHGRAGEELTLYSDATCTSRELASPATLERAPRLGDRVTLGVHAAVLGPVLVGSDTTIGFKAMVTADVPEGSVVVSRDVRTVIRPAEPAAADSAGGASRADSLPRDA